MSLLMGIDLGTSSIKVSVFDYNGESIGMGEVAYDLITPKALIVEQKVEVYWDAFCRAIKQVWDLGIDNEQISALSFSAQSETMMFLDRDSQPTRNAIVWLDNRGQKEADYINQTLTKSRIFKVTGQPEETGMLPAAKILWVKENEPEIFEKTSQIQLIEDYFIYRLHGKAYAEGSLWSSSTLYDIINHTYYKEMLDLIGIDDSYFPEIKPSARQVGYIQKDVANSLGFSEKTLIVMGGQDQICGAIGAGNAKEGILSESTGTALATCLNLNEPFFDKDESVPLYESCIPGKYAISAFGSGGAAYKWLKDTFCDLEEELAEKEEIDVYALLEKKASKIPCGCDGMIVLPHFQGSQPPDADQFAKCSINGLTLSHTKSHFIRAFMEGVALVLNRMVEVFEEQGISISEIKSISGGAKSPLWCQIKSDITGKDVIITNHITDAAGLGAAVLAGVGSEIYSSVEDAVEKMTKEVNRFFPNNDNHQAYKSLTYKYNLLMKTLNQINEKL